MVNTKAPGDGRSRNGTKSMRASFVEDPYKVQLKLKEVRPPSDAANRKTWGLPKSVVAKWSLYGSDTPSMSLYKAFCEALRLRKKGAAMEASSL